jgi:hypothetical protein
MDINISNIARYRPKYDADYYKIANRSLPVRWMAIESLLSGIYTEMSDVYGHLLSTTTFLTTLKRILIY